VEIGHQELRNRKSRARHQGGRPDFERPPEPGKSPNHPKRHEQRKEWQLPSDHRRELTQIKPGDAAQGDDRRPQRAERDRGGVGDQRQSRGLERSEPELHQERRGHRHRRPESRRALEKRSEGKRDQNHLNPGVRREGRQTAAQRREVTFLHGQVIEEDQVEHDPANRKKSVRRAVRGGGGGRAEGHAIGQQRDRQGDRETRQRGEMDAHFEKRN